MKTLIAITLLIAFVASVFWNYENVSMVGGPPVVGDDLDCSGPILALHEIRCWNLDGKWDD